MWREFTTRIASHTLGFLPPLRPTDCSQWAITDFRNRGKKANKLWAAEKGFLNHPVHKLVCTGADAPFWASHDNDSLEKRLNSSKTGWADVGSFHASL